MAGSSAQLRRLGAELRRLREAAGLTQTEVGASIGRSHASLVNWERGKTKISKSDLVCLLAELRVSPEVRKGLEKLRDESSRGAGQWSVYGLPDWLRPLVSFEEDAVRICAFEPVVIPGLLQTEAYSRAIHLASPYTTPASELERRLAARKLRQQRLAGTKPLKLHVIIAEAALRLAIGGSAVLAEQLRHLLELNKKNNITVQVLAAAAGAHPAMAGNFTVLHFAEPELDPPLGYYDGPLGGCVVSDEGDVATMARMFEDVRQAALGKAESVQLITGLLEENPPKGPTDG